MAPRKDKNGLLMFKEYPEFTPNLTPKEIFELGSFGGTYWRPIYSSITGKNYKNIHIILIGGGSEIKTVDNFVKKSYDKVTIEINGKSNLNELKGLLEEGGETKVNIRVKRESKVYIFSLKNPRKFNFSTFNNIKNKEYVKKISF